MFSNFSSKILNKHIRLNTLLSERNYLKQLKLNKLLISNTFTFCSSNTSNKSQSNSLTNTTNTNKSMFRYGKLNEPKEYKKLYVENLPHEWTEEDLKWRFEQIGEIEHLHIIKNNLGLSTGKGNLASSLYKLLN